MVVAIRLRLASCAGVGLACLAGALLAGGCDPSDEEPAETRGVGPGGGARRCEVGAERTARGAPAGRRAIVLGCGRTRDRIALQLVSFRDDGGPCLTIAGLPGGTRACGRAPSERVPPARDAIGGGAIVRRSGRAQLELYGETAPGVSRVVMRYRRPDDQSVQRPTTLIRAENRAALRAAGIGEPFGYFVGVVPARARHVTAIAVDRSGEVLGSLGFDRLVRSMHPTVLIAGTG